jgi:spore protease
MREIDLSKYKIRTDLVADIISNEGLLNIEKKETIDNCTISRIELDTKNAHSINKKEGNYTTIYFDDITDKNNYENILKIFIKELKSILSLTNISKNDTCLVIGLGNDKSTPDSLGPNVISRIEVTRHIYELFNSLEQGYRVVSALAPGVMGTTGIETSDTIHSLVSTIHPDFLIIIDALASDSIDRVLKTIQITNTGITPGSGIGNQRKEFSKEIFGIPVIAIGIPTVVDAVTIVNDTFNYMEKHFSYTINNRNNLVNKLIPYSKINYLKNNNYNLTTSEKTYFLGALGGLNGFEKKALIHDVLTPIGYNLMVTPKEVDFIIEKLSSLISTGINNSIHNITTK